MTEPEKFNLFYVGRFLLMKFAYKDRSCLRDFNASINPHLGAVAFKLI